ncbi:hypothetical protein OM428_10325 [Enterococcus gallinarum]|nr:hypothetical protein [Enterococcus gallinarum]
MAKKCNYSKSSIHRFAQKISYKGFSELKYALKAELEAEDLEGNLIDQYVSIIANSMNEMKYRDFSTIFQLIQSSKKSLFMVQELYKGLSHKRCVGSF